MWSAFLNFFVLSLFFSTLVLAEDDPTFKNTVYLIRNAETNTKKVSSGLSGVGLSRAACLPGVFGPGTNRTVGFIIAEPPMKHNNESAAVDTVAPLATALNITINTSCDPDDDDCVGDKLRKFAKKNPDTSMLVVWSSSVLSDIADKLGVNDVPDFPTKRFDVIWDIQKNKLRNRTSELCPGLNDTAIAVVDDRCN